VRLACLRHLNDLSRQGTDGFPYTFEPERSQKILDFFPELLTLETGEPFQLVGWQSFCLGSAFGWTKPDGKRRFQTIYIETGKGSGKTPLLAGVCLYGLAFDGEQSAEIYSAAFDRDQASIVLNDARRMAEGHDELAALLTIGKYNIADDGTKSFMRAVSSEHRSKSGPRPHFVAIDELHEHPDGVVVNKMRAGFKGRTQPVLMAITNSGHDRTSICWTYHQHSLAVLDGQITDEQWFCYVCHLDPCQACYDDGYRQPKDGCQACDDWTNPAVWVKANPSLGVTIHPAYLQTQVDLAVAMPDEQALVKRLNFCIWTETRTVWISPERWDACKVDTRSADNAGLLPAAMGLDPSHINDLTAAVVALRHDDAPGTVAPKVEIEGLNESGQRLMTSYTLNYTVELVPFFWMPLETLWERVKTERVPLDAWLKLCEKDGSFKATPGGAIDHQQVYLDVLGLMKRYRVQKLGMDENSGRFLYMQLENQGRLKGQIVSVGQGFKLSEAFKFLHMLILHKRLRHNGHPVLNWCFANAEPEHHKGTSAIRIVKPSDAKRIDGVIAAAMAVHQLMTVPATRPKLSMFVAGGRK
jgi:phage terminase large subunit-like protein